MGEEEKPKQGRLTHCVSPSDLYWLWSCSTASAHLLSLPSTLYLLETVRSSPW